jgi:tetratricopeptide (TPR) repeat protein
MSVKMGKRLALIVGNSVYQDQTLVRLKAPDVDVGSLHEVLKDPEVGGFEFVDLLINSKSSIVRRAISEFYSRKSRDDLLLLYFSGHGVLDERGRLYLAVKDTDHGLLSGTAVPASFIADEMDNSRSQRQVLILDCCHSGAFARGTKGSPGLTVGTASSFEGTGFGRVVLTATDATQYAWEGERVIGDAENSLFTHYLVRGLQSGEADANRDGQITIDELYDYVYAHVVQQTPRQTPGKWSFKEQGEIVIARAGQTARVRPAIKVQPFVDVELQQKLEQLYTKGLSAYWLEEWEQAAYNFQLILEIDPDYKDATEKFADVRRQLDLKNTYNKALAAFEAQKYIEAVTVFERLVAEAPDYKDAAAKLQVARTQSQIADLYSQARQLYQAQEWQAVLQVFERIAELAQDYTDPEELLPLAKREFDAQKRREDIQERYRHALRAMNSGNWQEARNGFGGIQGMEPGFEETERLLARVEAEISRQEAQKQLQERLGVLYGQVVGHSRAKQWQQALEKIVEIESLDPGFSDPHGIAARVRAEMRRLEQEAQRQNELAALYAEAVRLLRTGQYSEALEKWGEIKSFDQDFPDHLNVQSKARRRLATRTLVERISPALKQMPRWVLLISAMIVVAYIVMIAQRKDTEGEPIPFPLANQTAIDARVTTKELEENSISAAGNNAAGADTTPASKAAPTRTASVLAAIPSPDATPQGSAVMRLVITTSSDWTNVRIITVGNIHDISFVEIETYPDYAPEIYDENKTIGMRQPLQNAEAGNQINATVDVYVDLAAQRAQGSESRVDVLIEKGHIGEAVVEIFKMSEQEPVFPSKITNERVYLSRPGGEPTTDFPADTPFHILHGWRFEPGNEPKNKLINLYNFELYLDDVRVEEDFVRQWTETGDLNYLNIAWVYNFPDGMLPGDHVFTGHWYGPCQQLVDTEQYEGSCAYPEEVVEAGTREIEISFYE